jgi:2-succinyl-5-enolpyruvyl-6-hydroxy-3-cyclohexene-1-carboxylate synthase
VVAHYDALLRAPRWAEDHRPGIVLRLGDTPTSKPLRAWLAGARQLVVDRHAVWHEPTRAAERVIAAAPAPLCRHLAAAVRASAGRDDPGVRALKHAHGWLDSWLAADALVPPALAAQADPFEPKLCAALAEALPPEALLWVSSSMPIRDVETFLPATEKPIRVLSNRGANGIDGVLSSALGAAAATRGHAYLLTGELALLHDVGALLAAPRLGVELTIVCFNNGGGGIFDFLPVAGEADPEAYERLVATPSGVDLTRLAGGIGLRHTLVATPPELSAALAEPGLVEVRTERADNVARHRELFAALARELDARVA